jgi:enamine deaminase RidA (YjgF/YER057c/UK114 family)
MANYEALFEDEDNIFGGTPASKYHDIATQSNDEIVKDEFDKIVQKFAAMEQLLEAAYPDQDIDRLIQNHIFSNSSEVDMHKKGLYVEFTGNIVMRLDS